MKAMRFKAFFLFFFGCLLTMNSTAFSMDAIEINEINVIKQKLKEKYKEKIDIREYPDNPIDHVSISGDLTPADVKPDGNTNEAMRTMSRAFFEREKDLFALFGITNINIDEDVKDYRIDRETSGWASIKYYIYIYGVRLDGARISLNFKEDGTIGQFYAFSEPITSEMVSAAERSKAGPDKEDIRRIVRDEFSSSTGAERRNIHVSIEGKYVIATEPYVVWRAFADRGEWDIEGREYTLDAFTGEILKKKSAVIYD